MMTRSTFSSLLTAMALCDSGVSGFTSSSQSELHLLVTGPGKQRQFSPRSLVVAPRPEHEEEDTDDVLDAHEFLEENDPFVAQNGANSNATSTTTDPLQSMGNLTDKLAALSSQFYYQLSLAKDDRGQLETHLLQTQADRQKLQSLLNEMRHDKQLLEQQLQDTKIEHERIIQQSQAEHDRLLQDTKEEHNRTLQYAQREHRRRLKVYQNETQKLRTVVTSHQKELEAEQVHVHELQTAVQAQEAQIEQTESSTRRLLLLLWKLWQRRIQSCIVFIFPFVVRLITSLIRIFDEHYYDGDETAEGASAVLEALSS